MPETIVRDRAEAKMMNDSKANMHENLLDKLHEEFKEEIEGVEEYRHLEHKARMRGDDYMARGLGLIAADEETHARFLHDVLERHGYEISDEEEEAYHKMEAMFHRY